MQLIDGTFSFTNYLILERIPKQKPHSSLVSLLMAAECVLGVFVLPVGLSNAARSVSLLNVWFCP